MKIEARLAEKNIQIPALPPPPGGMYVPVKRVGRTLYVSGQIPSMDGKPAFTGKVAADASRVDDLTPGGARSLEYAQEAARLCIKNMLATLRAYTGDLDQIKGAVKLLAFVSSEVGFDRQHLVVNAASQLLLDAFGPDGGHARSAVGVNQLPLNVTVEIEGIFETWKDAEC